MMFNIRSTQKEIIDNLEFSDPLLIDNLKDMEKINTWLGFNSSLIKGIKKIYRKYSCYNKKLLIADLGCGSGDALRSIQRWANAKTLNLKLIGIDGNPHVINYACLASVQYPNIYYQTSDISMLDDQVSAFDIVTLNNLCHHLQDEDLIRLLKYLRQNTHLAIIINDLHRHFLAYLGIKILCVIFKFSSITKHDGPLSVRRAYKKNDIKNILNLANIFGFEIKWRWAFRWQVIIWCKNHNEN